jgi:D-alanyl-D-alanine carboxypeptidase
VKVGDHPSPVKDGDSGESDGRESSDGPAADQATAVFRAVRREEERAAGGKEPDLPEDAGKAGRSAASAKPKDSGGPQRPEQPEPRFVDQETAVFRAVKPADAKSNASANANTGAKVEAGERPAGDQPTTALKAVPPPPARPQAESEVERRTSNFVPLKSLDEPPASSAARPKADPDPGPASLSAPERTTKQPMPPRPPLDLLAELTNSPPPPETPLRNAVRRVKIWTPFVLLLLIVFAVVQAVRPLPQPTFTLTGESTYTFEGGRFDLPWPGEGQSVVEMEGVGRMGSEGAQKPAPIASVAKVMTAYVILKEHPLKGDEQGEMITVDQQAEDESSLHHESRAPLKKGQEYTQRQMLQMLMIPSGNNAARLLARWDTGADQDGFVDKMNAAAKDLGMKNTTYTDPSGLDSKTVSTATDQLKLAKAVMQDEVFRSIVMMASADIPGLGSRIYNNNDLLVTTPNVIGIKTGSSTPAGGNLMWAATVEVDGKVRRILGVVMGQQSGTGVVDHSLKLALANSRKLIQAAQQEATSAAVVKKGEVVGYVDDGLGGQTPVVATKELKAVGWSGLKVTLKLADGGETVPHSAKAGTQIGTLSVGSGAGQTEVPVALQEDLAEPGFGDRLTRLG